MRPYLTLLFSTLFAGVTFAQNLASFTQVGPIKFPANPSVQTTGMGRVSNMVYHPTDSNTLFAITSSGGVFKSANEGTTWKPISDMLPTTYCASLAINPVNPNVMYLGTGDANYGYRGGMGVWKTNNGGQTWFQSSGGIGNKLVSYILMTPGDTSTLIAACYDGIYKSTNAGSSWVKKTAVNASYRDLHYQPQSSNILYSATNTHFYRSLDNGNTWISSNVNSNITSAGIKIAVCPKDTSQLFCVIWKSGATSPFGGVYKSTDHGASFTLQADTPNILGYSGDGSSLNGQGAYNLAIASDPNDADVLYFGAINVWKSSNQGVSFDLKSHWGYGVHADKHGFLFSPYNPNKLYIYHDGGIDRTTDGGDTWTTLEDGLSASEFYKMGSSGLYKDNILGGLQDNGMDVAVDKQFSTVRGGDWGGDFAFDAFDKDLVYEDGGRKRNIVTHATSTINGNGGVYTVHPNDSNVMFEATIDVYRTQNLRANPWNAVSWTKISNFTGTTSKVGMAYAKSSSGTFYAAFRPQALYISTNINATSPSFTKLTSFPYTSGEQIRQLETSTTDSNAIYVVTTKSRILASYNKGVTWSEIDKNLPSFTIIKFLLDPNASDSSMYACNAFGVYYRNHFMTNWIPFSQGLPTVSQITDMSIMNDANANGRLHISTWGRGIWQTDLFRNSTVAPTADFTINTTSTQSCINTIIAVDNSYGSPLGRKWQISPSTGWEYVNGTDSMSSRAEIRFTTSGTYYISLRVYNSIGTDISTKYYNYSPLSVNSTCSTTTSNLGGYTIGIYKFELNTISNSSSTGNKSYEDFSCARNTILKGNTSYTAWVTNGNNYSENAKVYIDYNDDGDFLDANELVGTIASGLSRRSCTFTTPTIPPVNNKFIRLRVVSNNSTVNSPCGQLGYGQSEDYAVYIDNTNPVVTIQIPTPTVSNSFTAIFKTSEVVTGFDISDIYATNASVSNFTQRGIKTYSADITPVSNGQVSVQVKYHRLSDLAGNLNAPQSVSTEYFVGFHSFTFAGISVKDSILQTSTGGIIKSYVPFGTRLDSMVATFTLSDTTFSYIGLKVQTSGISRVDFSDTVTYVAVAKNYNLTSTYTVEIVENENTECDLLSFGFTNPEANGSITQTTNGGEVALTVPYGTSLSSLVSNFVVSDSATVYMNSLVQITGSTANDFVTPLTYTVVAQDTNFSKTYTVNVKLAKNIACDILTYGIETPASMGSITLNGNAGGTIDVYVPYGTSLENLIAWFTTSDSAQVYILDSLQNSGVTSNDFSNSVSYQVIAQDTNLSKIYTVNVFVSDNKESDLLTFGIVSPATSGTITSIDSATGNVQVYLPYGTALDNLTATFTVSDSARVFISQTEQQSGVTTNDFTNVVNYKVIAQDTNYSKTYVVTLSLLPNTAAELIDFSLVNPSVKGTITRDTKGGNVKLIVSASTDLKNLVAQFTLSDNASAYVDGVLQESTITVNNYSDTVVYTVTAEDGVTSKTYFIKINTSTSSVAKISNGFLEILPNPASNELQINATGVLINNSIYTYEITDALGQIIKANQLNRADAKINISDLSIGIYHLRIRTEDGYWIGKFLKE
ncbi:MAG: hypothetical protein COA58_02050 [Bacteroidetes bacterium]|nr:MAG: hypothetical protein COA58_02050 [Bacteroidota bacterium]